MKYLLLFMLFFVACASTETYTYKETIAKNLSTSDKDFPEKDDFVPCEKVAHTDMQKLQKSVVYPKEAIKNKIEGTVIAKVLVDKRGKVVKYDIIKSDSELLNDAALEAIINSEFTPAIQNGKEISIWLALPVVFKLK